MRQKKWIVVGATAIVATAGLSGIAIAETGPGLEWTDCEPGNRSQCTTLTVPIDREDTDTGTVNLALARIPAQNPDARRGTIIFQAGGPGPSKTSVTDPDSQKELEELTQWYDVLSFDARGFGESRQLCDPGAGPSAPGVLDSFEAYEQQRQEVAAYAKTCFDDDLLAEHANSSDVAHDIDDIREALGEEKIVYYGNSYGTVYGQEYAERYGEHLERLLLDSVVDHTSKYTDGQAQRAPLIEKRIERFAAWCDEDTSCELHGEDTLAVWDDVVAAADEKPLPVSGGGTVSGLQIRLQSGWLVENAELASALKQARDGSGDGYASIEDDYTERVGTGQLHECADFPVRPDDYDTLMTHAEDNRESAPRIGWLAPVSFAYKCAGWSLDGGNPPAPLDAESSPPALLINSTLDAASHLAGAQNVTDQLPNSRLLSIDGDYHAAYWAHPDNRCVRNTVHTYLLDGTLPDPDSRCEGNDPT
jgi:pimeloyl-ACP methyl ester carboxylesterase